MIALLGEDFTVQDLDVVRLRPLAEVEGSRHDTRADKQADGCGTERLSARGTRNEAIDDEDADRREDQRDEKIPSEDRVDHGLSNRDDEFFFVTIGGNKFLDLNLVLLNLYQDQGVVWIPIPHFEFRIHLSEVLYQLPYCHHGRFPNDPFLGSFYIDLNLM